MHAPGSSVTAEVLELLKPQSTVLRSPTASDHLRSPYASLTTSSTGAYTNSRNRTRAGPKPFAQNENDSHEAMFKRPSERALLERRFRQCNEILHELEPPQANDVDDLEIRQLRQYKQTAVAGPSTARRTVAPDTHDHRQAVQEVARRSAITDPKSTVQSEQSNTRNTGSKVSVPLRLSHARNAKSKVEPGFYASNRKWR